MISRWILSFILLLAGVLHLVTPQVFDPAIPFSYKLEINYLAGVIEIVLGLGLLFSNTRDLAARGTALWFIVLIPIHIYMAITITPIFGLASPWLHWARTLFQFVLIFWALSLQEKGWIISQRWSDVLFLHYQVEPELLQKKVPYAIDLFQGKAVVSIVPFTMSRIRFPFFPSLPGLSQLFELNLRTYVRVHGRPAVYFFTLDSNHLPGVLVARWAFGLPYRWRAMTLEKRDTYQFKNPSLELEAKILNERAESEFDLWTSERYALITKHLGQDRLGVVEHVPWSLQKVQLVKIQNQFSQEFIALSNFLGASYAQSLDVRFRPFTSLKRNGRDQS